MKMSRYFLLALFVLAITASLATAKSVRQVGGSFGGPIEGPRLGIVGDPQRAYSDSEGCGVGGDACLSYLDCCSKSCSNTHLYQWGYCINPTPPPPPVAHSSANNLSIQPSCVLLPLLMALMALLFA